MKSIMELNKETASRLWVKQFGKKQKAFDFAGREIARAAYNDRNSDYGWNVDHILPESRGGKTADHNLICCSIKTNDEKADRFPSFKANGKLFEIHRRENHYEIIKKSQNNDNKKEIDKKDDTINFFDAAQGLKCWKQCEPPKDTKLFVDYAKIKVEVTNNNRSALDKFKKFIEELFGTDNIFEESNTYSYSSNAIIFTVVNFDAPSTDDSDEILKNCTMLNTYREYLIAKTDISNIQILCGMNCYSSRQQMTSSVYNDIISNRNYSFRENLAISELIRINTRAKDDLGENPSCLSQNFFAYSSQDKWYAYNYTYTKLSENLKKRINN